MPGLQSGSWFSFLNNFLRLLPLLKLPSPSALPLTALLRDLPVSSPSTTWESSTTAAPQLTETPDLGASPRRMELVPGGDTVIPLALFKVQKRHNFIGEGVILAFHTQRLMPPQHLLLQPQLLLGLLSLLLRELARLCQLNP